jgi:hypothetical protein
MERIPSDNNSQTPKEEQFVSGVVGNSLGQKGPKGGLGFGVIGAAAALIATANTIGADTGFPKKSPENPVQRKQEVKQEATDQYKGTVHEVKTPDGRKIKVTTYPNLASGLVEKKPKEDTLLQKFGLPRIFEGKYLDLYKNMDTSKLTTFSKPLIDIRNKVAKEHQRVETADDFHRFVDALLVAGVRELKVLKEHYDQLSSEDLLAIAEAAESISYWIQLVSFNLKNVQGDYFNAPSSTYTNALDVFRLSLCRDTLREYERRVEALQAKHFEF